MNLKSLTLAVSLFLSFAATAGSATLDWRENATSTMWFSPSNWHTGVIPSDSLTDDITRFSQSVYAFQPDYGETSISGIIIGTGTGATANLTLSGSSLGIGEAGIVMMEKAGNVTVAGCLKLGADQTWKNNSTAVLTVGANITNAGNATAFTLVSDGSGRITIAGVISDGGAIGTTALSKAGNGTLTVSGANAHSGGTTVSMGTLVLVAGAKLGAATARLTMGGGQLDLGATSQTAGAVRITAAAGNAFATISNGNLTATSYTSSFDDGNAIVSARLFGSGNFTKAGNGTVTLSEANGYTGGTIVSQGSLALSGAGLLGSTTSNLTMAGGRLDLGATSQTVAAVRITAATIGGNTTIGNGNLTASSFSADFTSGTAVVSANLLGAGSFTKAGNGTLTLTGVNTYTGGTIVSQGKLALSGLGKLPGASSNLTMEGGELDLGATSQSMSMVRITAPAASGNATIGNGSLTAASYSANYTTGSVVVSASLFGSGNFTKSGNGTLTFSGANGYTGGTIINQGKLAVSGNGNLAGASSNLTLAGGQLDLGGTSQTTGTVRLTAPAAEGGFTMGNGDLSATSYSSSFASGKALVSANLLGAGGFTKTGNGVVTLTGANAYAGATTLSAGTLQVGIDSIGSVGAITSGALGKGNLSFAGGAALSSNGTTARTILNAVNFTGAADPHARIGDSVNNGKLTFRAGMNLGNPTYGRNLDINSEVQIDGAISNGLLNKFGPGTLTLNGTNTHAGGTYVGQGLLMVGANGNLGASTAPLTIEGGRLDLGGTTQTVGSVIFFGPAQNGGTMISNGNLTAKSYKADIHYETAVISANLQGSAAFNSIGDGVVRLSGNNTYSGATTVSCGTLQVGVGSVGSVGAITSSAVGTGTLTLGNATLSSDGAGPRTILNSVKLVSSDFNEKVQLGNATNNGKLTFLAKVDLSNLQASSGIRINSPVQIDGVISSGSLPKTGNATLTLAGANTYSGGTNIMLGTLALTGSGTLGTTSSALEMSGGRLDLGGTSQTVGSVRLTAPPASGETIANGNLTAASCNSEFASGTAIISASLRGSGKVQVTGAGTLRLSGNNTYSGGTYLNYYSGPVQVGADSTGAPGAIVSGPFGTGAVTVTAGKISSDGPVSRTILNPMQVVAGLSLGDTINNGMLTFAGYLDLASASYPLTVNSDVRFDGVVRSGAINKYGNATLLLCGNNTFSGRTELSAGTLQLGAESVGSKGAIASSALGTGPISLFAGKLSSMDTVERRVLNSVIIGGNAVVTLGDAVNCGKLTFLGDVLISGSVNTISVDSTVQFDGLIGSGFFSAGLINKKGHGSLILSGANTFVNSVFVSAGSLLINGSVAAGGNITVSAGTLGGTGRIEKDVFIGSSGILMPGVDEFDLATLTLKSGLVMDSGAIIQLGLSSNSTSHDVLAFAGAVPLVFASDQTFLFLDQGAVPGTNYSGILTGLMSDPGVGGWQLGNADWGGTFSYNAGSVDFLLLAVPEPSVWALVGFGLAILCLRGGRCVIRVTPENR